MPAASDCNNNLPDFLTRNELNYINKYQEYKRIHKFKESDSTFVKNVKIKLDSVTQSQIECLRNEVLDYIEQHRPLLKLSERYVHELTLDAYLKGFIVREHKNTVEKIVDSMSFLSELGELTDDTFPKEFLEFGLNFSSGFDLYGNPVFYIFVKRNFIPKKLFEHTNTYMAYIVYQLVRVAMFTNSFFTLLIDFSGASIANIDFVALRHLITILNDYAPACLNRIICHNIHWALRPAFRIGYALLPANVGEMMHSTNGRDINNYISNEQLFSFIEGGRNNEILLGKPKKNGTSFYDCCQKVNLTVDEATKLIEQFRKTLKKNKIELIAYD